jgi:iron complex outermembrane recepter protein
VTEAMVNAGYATTAHGDQSSNLDATLNIPFIADKLAVRGVIYNEHRGGYINNLPATFARAPTGLGISSYFNSNVPANSVAINNFNTAARAAYRGSVPAGRRLERIDCTVLPEYGGGRANPT